MDSGDRFNITAEDRRLLCGLPGLLLPWFGSQARDLPWRRDREPYHVWLSEIMLQQTRVEAVRGYYTRFLGTLPDIRALAAASEETVFKLWEGLGYYRRARYLHTAAGVIDRDMDGVFPSSYEGILALPGVGEYTAGAIASICFGLPKPAVDGNVLRVVARILDSGASVDEAAYRREVGSALEEVMVAAMMAAMAPDGVDIGTGVSTGAGAGAEVSKSTSSGRADASSARDADRSGSGAGAGAGAGGGEGSSARFDPGDFNQSLMEIGATVCLPKGALKCGSCPARSLCCGYLSGRAELLPVRSVKKARRIEERTVFILLRRADGGEDGEAAGTQGGEQSDVHVGLQGRGSYNIQSSEYGYIQDAEQRGGQWAGQRVALCRRGDSGLLAGLWELPNIEGRLSPAEALAQVASWNLRPLHLEQALDRVHVFTHVEWRMRAYVIRCDCPQPDEASPGKARAAKAAQPQSGAPLSMALPVETQAPDELQQSATPGQAGSSQTNAVGLSAPALVWVDATERSRAYPLPTAFRQFLV